MPTIAPCFEPVPPRADMAHGHASALIREGLITRMVAPKQTSRMHAIESQATEAPPLKAEAAKAAGDLPARMQQLIELEGSASALAERCGCSEGSVRNWREGRSDISRERCITIANILGVSVLWLVTGEGPMKITPEGAPHPEPASRAPSPTVQQAADIPRKAGLDSQLLAASLRLLQSYIGLVGGSLDTNSRADRVAELYDIFSHAGDASQSHRLISFHSTLSNQLRRNRTLIA